ncbi:hypothetical protein PAXRUDRAFT_21082 [Paxillus rubicundulus Ve08.2h10]|uniref:Uncharacterized protein n=1 Tax=Paxillus rubicundulus Ve08.2h10 TaxID=930991 RepID=A0A0D0D095_9AGAM|nr:hypothetical protein PAXRUDRAFT_21082 [Paxillus rubicundulus Ve08.2h10]
MVLPPNAPPGLMSTNFWGFYIILLSIMRFIMHGMHIILILRLSHSFSPFNLLFLLLFLHQ